MPKLSIPVLSFPDSNNVISRFIDSSFTCYKNVISRYHVDSMFIDSHVIQFQTPNVIDSE